MRIWWPAIAHTLHQPLSDIKAMTVDEFDDAIDAIKQIRRGGAASGGTG